MTEVCIGGSPSVATVRRALDGPFNFIDTAAIYSAGESERRIGLAIRDARGLPDGSEEWLR